MAPTYGGSFCFDVVCTPMDAPPTLTPCSSRFGSATKNEATPRTTATIPTQKSGRIKLPFRASLGCVAGKKLVVTTGMPCRRCSGSHADGQSAYSVQYSQGQTC